MGDETVVKNEDRCVRCGETHLSVDIGNMPLDGKTRNVWGCGVAASAPVPVDWTMYHEFVSDHDGKWCQQILLPGLQCRRSRESKVHSASAPVSTQKPEPPKMKTLAEDIARCIAGALDHDADCTPPNCRHWNYAEMLTLVEEIIDIHREDGAIKFPADARRNYGHDAPKEPSPSDERDDDVCAHLYVESQQVCGRPEAWHGYPYGPTHPFVRGTIVPRRASTPAPSPTQDVERKV